MPECMAKAERGSPAASVRPITVAYLRLAAEEARGFLSKVQYATLVDDVKRLSDWPNGPGLKTLDIVLIDDFFELRDKGGIYGKINVRVYFGILKKKRLVFILGAYKKEPEGQTPRYIVLKMKNRLRLLKAKFNE